MPINRLLGGVALIVALASAAGHAAPEATTAAPLQVGGVTLRAVTVELPDADQELPPGPGAELVAANCVACHSTGMILNQPALSKATWSAEVTKMRQTYKAPVAEEDVASIVAYLASMPIGR